MGNFFGGIFTPKESIEKNQCEGESLYVEHFFHYVISAQPMSKRKERIMEQFAQWGMRPNFFDAIMGNELSKEKLLKLSASEGLLTLGEIGCALSHLGVYRKLLESREPCVYVFEDDAKFTDAFMELQPKIQQFMEEQTKPTVLVLCAINGRKTVCRKLDSKVSIMRSLAGTRAHAYVLNRAAARNLLKAQTPVKIELDAWAIYQKLGFIRLYCLNQNVVGLDRELEKASTIDQISKRDVRDRGKIQRIKDRHIKNWYNHLTTAGKVAFFGRRISRHIKELYYENNEKNL